MSRAAVIAALLNAAEVLSASDYKGVKPKGATVLYVRQQIAHQRLVDYIVETTKASEEKAKELADALVKHKIVKLDPVMGSFHVKHGAYLEKRVLMNALKNLEVMKLKASTTNEIQAMKKGSKWSSCPVCEASFAVAPGKPLPSHRGLNSKDKCPGAGEPGE